MTDDRKKIAMDAMLKEANKHFAATLKSALQKELAAALPKPQTIENLPISVDAERDEITIAGTRYSGAFFRELGCNFPNQVGQIVEIREKQAGVVTLGEINKERTLIASWHAPYEPPEYKEHSTFILLNPCDGLHIAYARWYSNNQFDCFTNWTQTEVYDSDFFIAWAEFTWEASEAADKIFNTRRDNG